MQIPRPFKQAELSFIASKLGSYRCPSVLGGARLSSDRYNSFSLR
jgi:hypothetical protein